MISEFSINEWTEFAALQMGLKYALKFKFAAEPGFTGHTVGDLVDFTAMHLEEFRAGMAGMPPPEPGFFAVSESKSYCLAQALPSKRV